MIQAISLNDVKDRIVQIERAAYVNFYVAKHELREGFYLAYMETKDQGLQLLDNYSGRPVSDEFDAYHSSQEQALKTIERASQRLLEILNKKRNGLPTAKQVYFLFTHRIPIPLDLTWGQASDLIDECLNQIAYEREAAKQAQFEKYYGFQVGDRVSWLFTAVNIVENGTISRLREMGERKLATIKLDSGGILSGVDVDQLQKAVHETEGKE